ncbi:molybdate ABC transporter substrate-binding protein [Caldimonas sp.]|uniref:molybdate ABC transporter substrate-binding protein n=1 Tax=Caldimonas sp. TaxID=2838790 RepID=UPI00391C05E3
MHPVCLPRRRLLGLVGLGLLPSVQAQTPPTLAAASDLKFALEAVAARFERDTGHKLRLVFGSSGNLHAQILQGAPFQMFMSADEDFVFKLAEAGKTRDRGRLYALGRIGILVPHGSPLKADGQLQDLAAALRDGRLKRLAIANPEHAPYGARAKEALEHAGLWTALQPHLVYGENVSQAAQFATSGSAQGGIVAQSLALAPPVARLGRFDLIAQDWHLPLRQRMVLMKDAPPALQAFYDALAEPAAQAIMTRYGFQMPRE